MKLLSITFVALVFCSCVLGSLINVPEVYAVGAGGGGQQQVGGGGAIKNPLGNVTFTDIVVRFTNWLLGLVAVLTLLGVVFGGFRMVAAVGDENQLASSKKIILWSIAGLTISILALTIINVVVRDILGVTDIHFLIPEAYAQVNPPNIGAELDSLEGATGLKKFAPKEVVANAVNFIASIAGLAALAIVIWGGVIYMLSAGDDQRAEKAKKIIWNGIIGLMIIIGAFVIIRAVLLLFGIGVVLFAN